MTKKFGFDDAAFLREFDRRTANALCVRQRRGGFCTKMFANVAEKITFLTRNIDTRIPFPRARALGTNGNDHAD